MSALLAVLFSLLGLVTTVKGDECHEDAHHYCVSIKCAAGAGYVLLVEWADLEKLNPTPHGKHRGYDVHPEQVTDAQGQVRQFMHVVRLSVGQGVQNVKVKKNFEFTFHASWGGFKKLTATKSGNIDCTGLAGSPKCDYK